MKVKCKICGQVLTDENPSVEAMRAAADHGGAAAILNEVLQFTYSPILDQVVNLHLVEHAKQSAAV